MRQGTLIVLALAGVLVAGYSLSSQARPNAQAAQICMWVLDVGQGDAQLLSLPGGEWWLVDAGGWGWNDERFARQVLLPQIRREGVTLIDRLFITHSDTDHLGGVRTLLDELPVGEVWIPTRQGQGRALARVVDLAARKGIPVHVADEGATELHAPPPARVEVVHPWPGWLETSPAPPGPNGGSLVLRVLLGETSFLLTGDIEAPDEARILAAGKAFRSTVMKVPHHGSRTSSSLPFVRTVAPLVAVAGAAAGNRFGFPHASVAARYLGIGTPFYWTGRHGTVRLCTDGWTLAVDHRPRGGSWGPLRSWERRDLSEWGRRVLSGPSVMGPVATSVRERLGSPPSSKSRRRGRTRLRTRRCVPNIPPEKASPVLLEERDWERRRRRREKLR